MTPNPWMALLKSRKAIVSVFALGISAAVLLLYHGPLEEKIAAMTAIVGVSWKLVDSIAVEDVGKTTNKRPIVVVDGGIPKAKE